MKEAIDIKPIPSPSSDECSQWFKNSIIQFPSNTLINGGTNSGKSTEVVRLITSKKSKIIEFFGAEDIFIFAVNNDTDYKIRFLMNKLIKKMPDWADGNLFTDIDGDFLEDLWKDQVEIAQEDPDMEFKREHQILLIFDDQMCNEMVQKRFSFFSKLFSQGRHKGFSVMLLSQSMTMISTPVRKNIRYMVIHRCDGSDRRLIYDKMGDEIGYGLFEQIYDQATDHYNGSGFLVIDTHFKANNRRFWFCFLYAFIIKNSEEEKQNILYGHENGESQTAKVQKPPPVKRGRKKKEQ